MSVFPNSHYRLSRRHAGFTLVELLVAMLLGLFLIGAIIGMFISNKEAYRINENLARMQEGARIVNELMSREIREAGANPCGTPLVANVLNNKDSAWWADWNAGAITGFDDGQDTAPRTFGTGTADRVSGTDAFIIRTAGMLGGVAITGHVPNSAQFFVNKTDHGIGVNDIIMVCDYKTAAITQVTGPAAIGTNNNIVHNTGQGTPGNCSKGLGYPTPDPCNNSAAGTNLKSFNDGFITKLMASFWYVGYNAQGGKSLFRMAMDGDPDNIVPVEIQQNVDDLQVEYLTRNGTTLASSYTGASSISDWSDSATDKVVAARVSLTLSSDDKNVSTDRDALSRLLVNSVSLRNREIVE